MTRIAITGGPKTGKTTLARKMSGDLMVALVSTDDYADLGWSESSQAVADRLAEPGAVLVEGVAVPRALRKAIAERPETKPIDKLIVLQTPKAQRTDGQRAMAKGVHTVLGEILPDLRRLGVEIEWHRDGES